MPKKIEIKPKIRATLAKDFQGEKFHPAGSAIAIACKVISRDLGELIVTIPDPVSLFLNKAEDFIESLTKSKSNIISKQKYQPSPYKEINKYLQSSMAACIFLIAAIESFLNIMIPQDHIYKHKKKGELNKEEIQRELNMYEKIDLVLAIHKSNVKSDVKIWAPFIGLLKLRGEIVHFKDLEPKDQDPILAELFDANFTNYFSCIKSFILAINPGYFD